MNELAVKPQVELSLGNVTLKNKEAIIKTVQENLEKYKNLVVSEETLKEIYSVRAELNKAKSAIDDYRKQYKQQYLEPLEQFEADMNEIKEEVSKVHSDLDKQYKEVESKLKEEKRKHVLELIDEYSGGYDIEFDNRWLNKTQTDSKIIQDIKDSVFMAKRNEEELQRGIEVVKNHCETHELEPSAWIVMVERGADVLSVLNEINDYIQRNSEIEQATVEPTEEVKEVEEEVKEAEPVQEAQEFTTKPELLTEVIKVTGTISMLQILNEFCKEVGIEVSAYESRDY